MDGETAAGFETELLCLYGRINNRIVHRLAQFKNLWKRGSEEDLLCELLFCLLTPAARAHAAWDALQNLKTKGLILSTETAVSTPSAKDSGFRSRRIADELRIVRFKNNKARNVMEAERYFTCEGSVSVRSRLSCFQSTLELREWLAATIRGMGYKEASHFLRNIGRGDDIAILDRHILRCLKRLGIIDTVPEGLTEKRYIHTEQRMRNLALRLGIPLSHLDILFWYHETGEIFK